MSKSLKVVLLSLAIGCYFGNASAQDAAAGEKVFKKCSSCHAVGDGAKNKSGPQLNDIFGRIAGQLEGFKFSKAMRSAGENGLIWTDETMDQFITKPKTMIKKTKMAFAGLKKPKDRENLIAYLKTFSSGKTEETSSDPNNQESQTQVSAAKASAVVAAKDTEVPSHGVLHLGRKALKEEVAAWDIDVRPDGLGLPIGKGSVLDGEPIYIEQCAICHGDFGEGIDRWPVLAGGHDTLTEDRPEKTVGSYWPYLSTVYDYIRRAMPFGNARSLTDDQVYALTAYVLYLNDIVEDEDFVLSNENFTEIRLPNEQNFISDNRNEEPQYGGKAEPCMQNCKPGKATVVMRARVLDVTPEAEGEGQLD